MSCLKCAFITNLLIAPHNTISFALWRSLRTWRSTKVCI